MSTDTLTIKSDRGPAVRLLLWTLKTAALWLVLLVGAAVAGKLIVVQMQMPPQDGPLSTMQAFLLVNGLMAISLALVAAKARVAGWRLALVLFVGQFVIGSAMMQIETIYFNESVHLPMIVIGQLVTQAAVIAALVSIAGALLFHPEREALGATPGSLVVRIGAMALIYVVLYYTAGFFIAWQSEAVRVYYSNGIHIAFLPTVAFQIFRGTLWALIALFIVTRLKGPLLQRALIMAVLFAVMTAAQLLYPNPVLPWAVRQAHLLEVASSEFAYGIIVTIVLLAGTARRQPANVSPLRLAA